MRLYVLTEDLRLQWDGVGSLDGGKIVSRDGKVRYEVGPGEMVLTPTEKSENPDRFVWILKRGADGSAFFFAPQREEKGLVYLTRKVVDSRADESLCTCFVAHVEEPERYFRQVESSNVTNPPSSGEGDDDALTYDEDGERGPDDSLGPADTNIPTF